MWLIVTNVIGRCSTKRQIFGPTWRFANVCEVLLPFGLRVSWCAVTSLVPVFAKLLEFRPEHLDTLKNNSWKILTILGSWREREESKMHQSREFIIQHYPTIWSRFNLSAQSKMAQPSGCWCQRFMVPHVLHDNTLMCHKLGTTWEHIVTCTRTHSDTLRDTVFHRNRIRS